MLKRFKLLCDVAQARFIAARLKGGRDGRGEEERKNILQMTMEGEGVQRPSELILMHE